MTKRLTLVALLFSLCIGVAAQKEKSSKRQIVGLWQQFFMYKEEPIFVPFFKNISKDKTFYTYVFVDKKKGALKTNIGSYRLKNDSTLVEDIALSRTLSALTGKKNTLHISFSNDAKVMQLKYRLPNYSQEITEYWQRVE